MANITEAKEVFEEIYLWLINAYGDDIYRIKTKVLDLLFIIDKELPYKLNEIYEIKDSYVLRILKTNNKEELRNEFLNYLSAIATQIQKQKGSNTEGVIPMCEYVNRNYIRHIIKRCSKGVNLSYNYLSKVFKGNRQRFYRSYRIEDGEIYELLSNKPKYKEICQQIGYNDLTIV